MTTPDKMTNRITLHGLGFIQVQLEADQRLHVWHPELPRRNCFEYSHIHSHRFSFESKVLVGTQINVNYRIAAAEAGTHIRYVHEGARSPNGGRPNHWPEAVHWHAVNHPDTMHLCQDLHQADWSRVPRHDGMLASPCCQGFSRGRGKAHGNPQHDASRSTAWAVVSAAEYHRPPFVIVENVPEFIRWTLYPAWEMAMRQLGYQLAPHIVDCADLGVPQNRVRIFIVCTLSKAPLMLQLPTEQHRHASSFIDLNTGTWSPINKPGRAAATLARIANGRRQHGDRFLMPYYKSGSGLTGRALDRPIGTLTTRDRWAIVDGDRMRMLTAKETLLGMSFPASTQHPANHRLTVHMAGNAVPPLAGAAIIKAVQEAA